MGMALVPLIGAVWALAAACAVAFGAAAKRADARRAAIIARRMAQQPAPAAYESGRFKRYRTPGREPAGTSLSD